MSKLNLENLMVNSRARDHWQIQILAENIFKIRLQELAECLPEEWHARVWRKSFRRGSLRMRIYFGGIEHACAIFDDYQIKPSFDNLDEEQGAIVEAEWAVLCRKLISQDEVGRYFPQALPGADPRFLTYSNVPG